MHCHHTPDQHHAPIRTKKRGRRASRSAATLMATACLTASCLAAGSALADTTLALKSGWNLVSSPTPVQNVADTFGDQGKFVSVWSWDATAGTWKSFLANSGLPPTPGFGTMTVIPSGEGFWVNSVGEQNVTLLGTASTGTDLPVVAGWNLKGVNAAVDDVKTVFAGKAASVWSWDGNKWKVFLNGEPTPGSYASAKGFGQLTTLSPGEGFWVNIMPGQGGTLAMTPAGNGGNSGGTNNSGSPDYQLLAWNDLGMHCMDGNDFSVFSILPPYNNLVAQLIKKGNGSADRITSGVTITYEAEPSFDNKWNTISSTKTNFWDYVGSLFGASLATDIGLKGNAVQSTTPHELAYHADRDWWTAEGIPTSPKNDDGTYNHYPMVKVVARDSTTGAVLATTTTVLPLSDEIDCKKCHGSQAGYAATKPGGGWINNADPDKDYKLNILSLHDEQNGTTLLASAEGGSPVLCASCHKSNALGTSGLSGVKSLSAALHSRHATAIDPANGETLDASTNRNACYACHPGSTTQCLRGAMGKAKDANGTLLMQCQSCHGGMSAVGSTSREGWLDEPGCQNCHHDGSRDLQAVSDLSSGALKAVSDTRFATNNNTPATGKNLYRFSTGHGLLQCEACHGATHAIYPSLRDEDNLQSISAQGHAGTIAECNVCHLTTPQTTNGGPHGMHTVGQDWIENHPDAAEGNAAACAPCHGSDYQGSFLSKTFSARTFSVEGTTKSYAANQPVSCYDCHNGPDGEGEAPTNSGQTGTTAIDTAQTLATTCLNCHGNNQSKVSCSNSKWQGHNGSKVSAAIYQAVTLALTGGNCSSTGNATTTTTTQGTTVTTTTQAPNTVNAATALATTCLNCHGNNQSKVSCSNSKWQGHNGSKVSAAIYQAVTLALTGGNCSSTGNATTTTTTQGTAVTTTTQAPNTVNAATALATTCLSCHSNKQSKVKCSSSKWLGHNGSKVSSAIFQAVSQSLTGGTCQTSTGTSSDNEEEKDTAKSSEKD